MAPHISPEQAKRLRAMRVRHRVQSLMRGMSWKLQLSLVAVFLLFAVPLTWRSAVRWHNRTAGTKALQSLKALQYASDDTTGALRLTGVDLEARDRHVKYSRWIPRQWELRGTADLRNHDVVDHHGIRSVAELLDANGSVLVASRPSLVDFVQSRYYSDVRTPRFWATHEQMTAARTLRMRIITPVEAKAPPEQVALNALAVTINSERPSLGLGDPRWWAQRDAGGRGWRVRTELRVANDRFEAAGRVVLRGEIRNAAGDALAGAEVDCGRMDEWIDWRGELPPIPLTDAKALDARTFHFHLAVK